MPKISISGELPLPKKSIIDLIRETVSTFHSSDFEIEVDFVTKQKIRELNKKFRQIDKPTDVLSFPQIKLPGQTKMLLGNIVISEEVSSEKKEEIADVIKHGILHLLGYNHETNAKSWEAAAKKIKCEL